MHVRWRSLHLPQARFGEGYINEADPSVLRFLIASRDEVSSTQLRDDLLSMLVAGHETTGSVLTWTMYLLEQNPSAMAKVQSMLEPVYCTFAGQCWPRFCDGPAAKDLGLPALLGISSLCRQTVCLAVAQRWSGFTGSGSLQGLCCSCLRCLHAHQELAGLKEQRVQPDIAGYMQQGHPMRSSRDEVCSCPLWCGCETLRAGA